MIDLTSAGVRGIECLDSIHHGKIFNLSDLQNFHEKISQLNSNSSKLREFIPKVGVAHFTIKPVGTEDQLDTKMNQMQKSNWDGKLLDGMRIIKYAQEPLVTKFNSFI
jgi:hypothetical protein